MLGVVAAGLLLATAKAEESEDIIRFGKAYREYMARTRVFIPFVF